MSVYSYIPNMDIIEPKEILIHVQILNDIRAVILK